MENQRNFKAPRLNSLDGFSSPINMSNFVGGRRCSPISNPYSSDSSNSPSPLMKYLRSADPAAVAASSPVARTPVTIEDDVIVMDGIPMSKSNRGGGEVRVRLPRTSTDSVIGGLSGGRSTSNTMSSSMAAGRVSQSVIRNYRIKTCRSWETSGARKFGSECQFAHSKDELCYSCRFSGIIKPEIFSSDTSTMRSSSSSYNTKYPLNIAAEPFSSLSLQTRMSAPTTPIQVKPPSESINISSTIPGKSYTSSERSSPSPSSTKYPLNKAAEPFLPSLQTQMTVLTTPVQVKQPSGSPVISSTTPGKSYNSSEGSTSSSSPLQTRTAVPTTPVQVKQPSESPVISSTTPGKSYNSSEGSTSSSLQTRTAVPTTPVQVKQPSGSPVISSTTPGKSYNSSEGSSSSSSSSPQTRTAVPTTPIQVKQPSEKTVIASEIPNTQLPLPDWIPQDDGIDFPVPSIDSPTWEDVIAYLLKLQYGTRLEKRLPVFDEICPE